MPNTGCGLLAVAGVVLLSAGGRGEAAVIPTLFSTGVDASGVVLTTQYDNPHGIADPHYSLRSYPDGAMLPMEVLNYDQWLAGGPNSAWIAPLTQTSNHNGYGDYVDIGPPGYYDYQTTFDLTGFDPSTASISGVWIADNHGFDILINGISTGQQTNPNRFFDVFGLIPFSISGGFHAGINTLDFLVENFDGPGDNPTGLRVEFLSATATPAAGGNATTPEPSAALLWGTGTVLAGAMIRRRRKLADALTTTQATQAS